MGRKTKLQAVLDRDYQGWLENGSSPDVAMAKALPAALGAEREQKEHRKRKLAEYQRVYRDRHKRRDRREIVITLPPGSIDALDREAKARADRPYLKGITLQEARSMVIIELLAELQEAHTATDQAALKAADSFRLYVLGQREKGIAEDILQAQYMEMAAQYVGFPPFDALMIETEQPC